MNVLQIVYFDYFVVTIKKLFLKTQEYLALWPFLWAVGLTYHGVWDW